MGGGGAKIQAPMIETRGVGMSRALRNETKALCPRLGQQSVRAEAGNRVGAKPAESQVDRVIFTIKWGYWCGGVLILLFHLLCRIFHLLGT